MSDTTITEWKFGDPPETLWDLIHEAQDRNLPLMIKVGASGRVPKNPSLSFAGFLVLDADLAFEPKRVWIDTRALVDSMSIVYRAIGHAEDVIMNEIVAHMGLDDDR